MADSLLYLLGMNIVHIKSIDLNLLIVAGALFRHKNVSRAAEDLGLSQSAVSHALTRLRDLFQDPLFVRTAKGMATTEYARKIQNEVLDILYRAERLVTKQEKFDPRTARSRITIASTDYFEIVVMARLQELLAKEAPLLQISLRPTRGELPKRDLEEGIIDLAIAGFYKDLPEGFYQSKLFTDDFLCAARADHPSLKGKALSLEQYFNARHALITLQGDFRERAKGRERVIAYGSYSFTGMAWVLQQSDLLLTAPALLIGEYSRYFPLNAWPCPVEKSGIDVRMLWHAQTHEDPLRIWFRQKLKAVCAEVKAGER